LIRVGVLLGGAHEAGEHAIGADIDADVFTQEEQIIDIEVQVDRWF